MPPGAVGVARGVVGVVPAAVCVAPHARLCGGGARAAHPRVARAAVLQHARLLVPSSYNTYLFSLVLAC